MLATGLLVIAFANSSSGVSANPEGVIFTPLTLEQQGRVGYEGCLNVSGTFTDHGTTETSRGTLLMSAHGQYGQVIRDGHKVGTFGLEEYDANTGQGKGLECED